MKIKQPLRVIIDKINSLELYLKYDAGKVIKTYALEDIGCGIYPCYYYITDNHLRVATSVSALVVDKKVFELNKNFHPPNYLNLQKKQNLLYSIFSFKKEQLDYYSTWWTIDKKIAKLKPMQTISLDDEKSIDKITPKIDITYDKERFISSIAHHIKMFINNMENDFPDYKNIVLTGGLDSQIILLTPKINPQNWAIFSAEPNYPVVKKWIADNEINVQEIHHHNNNNEETERDYIMKVIASDCYGNPQHIRWLPSLEKIAQKHNHQCIFWSGTSGDALNTNKFNYKDKQAFWNLHINRVSCWQGNYHQTFKNFTKSVLLSPYHSKEIWDNVYSHYSLDVLNSDYDLRKKIAEKLFNKPVIWTPFNPSPKPYNYPKYKNGYRLYKKYISNLLKN